ncbi:MAG: hypothetical protein COA44_05675 [Arcobacter sp.]|nr:MAG: hypothetical protein COA44_05675 [Arcobacter sp.]
MKKVLLFLFLQVSLFSDIKAYEELSKQIIRELHYIYQGRAYTGGSTFAKARTYKYQFKIISSYEIEITRKLDGKCLEEPFIIDLRDEYFIELQVDDKCDPALVISHDLDIIYLYVKDRCGGFGGYNLYKKAKTASVLLKEHFYKAYKLSQNFK